MSNKDTTDTTAQPLDSDPRSNDEFIARYSANMRLDGTGVETAVVEPCPFCAAPNFRRYTVLHVAHEDFDATCARCGRTARYLFTKTYNAHGDVSSVHVELVQTGGADVPSWHTAKPRRLDV